jgi:hypothetical protein
VKKNGRGDACSLHKTETFLESERDIRRKKVVRHVGLHTILIVLKLAMKKY